MDGEAAVGKGTPSILLGTSTRAAYDICPQCGEADLEPTGAKHTCPVCGFIQPCCNP